MWNCCIRRHGCSNSTIEPLLERWSVVDTVACHAHDVAAPLKNVDNVVFVFWKYLHKSVSFSMASSVWATLLLLCITQAQAFPEHKYHIVDILQRRGHIVGMTGDGVNDAPALKKADCGIAVSGATDAARAAASIVLLTSGLSVIIDAIKESRRIFQRMNSYAIYRIAETLRVLFFMTLAILVFNFYPLTAVMIVMLALLNDGAILSIAYDNVLYKNKPESWNMRLVLSISTVLGVIGVAAAFLLFYLGERVFHMDRLHIQTLMYLKLSIAGHLTIFLTRTRGPFWSIRPARILWIAVLGTQTIATLIAVYGLFMAPLGWKWAGFVWAYALIWALINDRVKLLAYRIFDPAKPALLSRRSLWIALPRSQPAPMSFISSESMARVSRTRIGLKRSERYAITRRPRKRSRRSRVTPKGQDEDRFEKLSSAARQESRPRQVANDCRPLLQVKRAV